MKILWGLLALSLLASTAWTKSCKWLEPVRGKYNEQNAPADMQLTGVSIEECKEEVESSSTAYLSFSYDSINRNCILKTADRTTRALSAADPNYVYYERACNTGYPNNCIWETKVGKYSSGSAEATLTGVTKDECQDRCEEADVFRCMSFDYEPTTRKCFLKMSDLYTDKIFKSMKYIYSFRNCLPQYHTCQNVANATFIGPFYGFETTGSEKPLSLTNATVQQCMLACTHETEFMCLGFDYYRFSGKCTLNRKNRATGATIKPSQDYDVYELESCPDAQPRIRATKECTWFDPVDGYISDGNGRELHEKTVSECKLACETETASFCTGFDHRSHDNFCRLHVIGMNKVEVTLDATYQHYERSCEEGYPEDCRWRGPYVDRAMPGHKHREIDGLTPAKCRAACVSEDRFICKSFDFKPTHGMLGRCLLSMKDRYSTALEITGRSWYYERTCNMNLLNCWEGAIAVWSKVKMARRMGDTFKTIGSTTVKSCKRACLQAQGDFKCIAIDYERQGGKCSLGGRSTRTHTLKTDGAFQYYEILSCRGNAPKPARPQAAKCVWVGPVEGYRMNNPEKKMTQTLMQCKAKCLKNNDPMDFICKSFSHNQETNHCLLFPDNRFSKALEPIASYDYYEKDCGERSEFPDDCTWTTVVGKSLSAAMVVDLTDKTEDECKFACEHTETFRCMSFNYNKQKSICLLSMFSRYDASLSIDTSVNYWERNCDNKFKYCYQNSGAIWRGPIHGKRIKSTVRRINNINASQCKVACLQSKNFHCISFFYSKNNRNCYLSQKNSENDKLVDSSEDDYYEVLGCPEMNKTERAPTPEFKCKWRPAVEGRYFPKPIETLNDMTVKACKLACSQETVYDCRSFYFHGTTCYMSSNDRSKHTLLKAEASTYYERDCSPTWETCKWGDKRARKYIREHDHHKHHGKTVDDCKTLCVTEQDFFCKSFVYHVSDKACYLSRKDMDDEVYLNDNDNYDFYERKCDDRFRNCNANAHASWKGPVIGKCINTGAMKTLRGLVLDECQRACLQEDTFACRSIQHTGVTLECQLKSLNTETSNLIYCEEGSYYEIEACRLGLESVKELTIEWQDVRKGYYIHGYDLKTLYNHDIESCKTACEEEDRFVCRSFDFEPMNKVCYLQAVTMFDEHLTLSGSTYYFEIKNDHYPSDCQWSTPMRGRGLNDYLEVLTDVTVDECKAKCEEAKYFNCLSFDYHPQGSSGDCYLSMKSRYSMSLGFHKDRTYYERDCYSKYRSCRNGGAPTWSLPQFGKHISGHTFVNLSAITLHECKEACLQHDLINCRSIEYNALDKICGLQPVNTLTNEYELTDSDKIVYFDLSECALSVEGSRRSAFRSSLESEEESGKGCHWIGPLDSYFLEGHDYTELNSVSPADCMRECRETDLCKSFDYMPGSKRCFLNNADRFAVKLKQASGNQYYEHNCHEKFPHECLWEGPVEARRMPKFIGKVVDSGEAECKKLCETECSFHCYGYNYNRLTGQCELVSAGRYTGVLEPAGAYAFYERNCENRYRLCRDNPATVWDGPFYGKSLAGVPYSKVISGISPDQCKFACQQVDEFHCTSFAYKRPDMTCYLTGENRDSAQINENSDFNYYEIESCPGDQPEVTEGDQQECIPDDFYVASCHCTGDPHCTSFDGLKNDFQGTCFYTAARDNCVDGYPHGQPSWEIIVNNNANSPTDRVSWVKAVHISLKRLGLEIAMYPDHSTVNKIRVQGYPMSFKGGRVMIVKAGSVQIVSVKGEVQVLFNKNLHFEIKVQTKHRQNICGMCGNFNGDSADDWTIGNTPYCMSKYPEAVRGEITANAEIFGTSWTSDLDDDEESCSRDCKTAPPPVGCDVKDSVRSEDHCNILRDASGPFAACLVQMSSDQAESIFDNCVYDACYLQNFETVVCRHASSMATVCNEQFSLAAVWRSAEFCPMECPANMKYQSCGNPCFPTCKDPKGENCGDLGPCIEGCFCLPGFIYDGEKCINFNECGCDVPERGFTLNVGQSYRTEDCRETCVCGSAGADLECKDTACQGNFKCGSASGVPVCQCQPPFVQNGDSCEELSNPCDQVNNGLHCFTCSGTSDNDCEQSGKMDYCNPKQFGNEPMCYYRTNTDSNMKVMKVQRGCTRKRQCLVDAVGLGILFCDKKKKKNAKSCYRCNYGDTDQTADGALISAECRDLPKNPLPSVNACALPKNNGKGKKKISMFYYDSGSGQCKTFKYKGSKGNDNRFSSLLACEATCIPEPASSPGRDPCEMHVDYGTGKKSLNKWFYNRVSGNCEEFVFKGAGGNDNRFSSQRQCIETCKAQINEICMLKIKKGSAPKHKKGKSKAVKAEKRWGFDKHTNKCVVFKYLGSKGNANNFKSYDECKEFCFE